MKYIATVCFFIKDDQVLLVEIEYPDGRKLWNGIGGKVDNDESPIDAVIREIGEETKLIVDKANVIQKHVFIEGDFELHIFVTSQWLGEPVARDPTLKRFKWFTFNEVPYKNMHNKNDEWLPAVLEPVGN